MQYVEVAAESRTETGKSANKKLRNQGLIPAVVYGGDNPAQVAVTHKAVKALVYTPDFKLAKLNAGDGEVTCFIKDLQFHPVTDEIVHIDFLRLQEGKKVKVDIPVRTKGVSPGVKEGGKLVFQRRKVTILTEPEHLIDEIFVDISNLALGNSVRVNELIHDENIQVMTPGSIPVAIVEIPRALKSAAAEAEKAAAAEQK